MRSMAFSDNSEGYAKTKCDVWDRVEKYTDVSQSFTNLIEAEKSAAPKTFRAIVLHCRVIVRERTFQTNTEIK